MAIFLVSYEIRPAGAQGLFKHSQLVKVEAPATATISEVCERGRALIQEQFPNMRLEFRFPMRYERID